MHHSVNLKTVLLLCAALCLPAVDYEAGIATLGSEVAAALSARKDKLELRAEARLDIPALTELFKLLRPKLPPEQQNMTAEAIATIAEQQAARFGSGYTETITALRAYPNADATKPVRYMACSFRSPDSTRLDTCDAEISAKLLFTVPVKDGQDTLRLDANVSRIGDRFVLVEVNSPEFKSP